MQSSAAVSLPLRVITDNSFQTSDNVRQTRRYSSLSNPKLSDRPSEQPSTQRTNSRKRPHSYNPSSASEAVADNVLQEINDSNWLHVSKRSRAAEWPLANAAEQDKVRGGSYNSGRKSVSPHLKRKPSPTTRPSKFIEGSMNDRVSKKPPSMYMRDEEAMDRYTAPAGAATQSGHRDDAGIPHDANITSSRPSSMFRFGKAIVNAFNPANMWHGINGIWKELEEAKFPETSVLQERQAKAERAYADLKKSGFKGTKIPVRASEDLPTIRYESIAEQPREATFRDSGIDIDGYRSSTERSKNDQVISPTDGLMPPPPLPASGRSPSPMNDASSARASSLSLHKPSFHNPKKVKSHFHLSPSKRAQSEISLPLPSIVVDGIANKASTAQTLRNQPSKKDLMKQQKLNKRVSDLETKLEKARRELGEIQEPSKLGLKSIKPGVLPSLPSQRIFENPGSDDNVNAGKEAHEDSKTAKEPASSHEHELAREVSAQLDTELKTSVSKSSLSKKRKNGDTIYKPSRGDDADDSGYELTKTRSVSKQASVRSRKSQKIADDVSIQPIKVKNDRNITPNGPRRISSRKLVNPVLPPNAHSPREAIDPVPPLPATPNVFDTTKIDRAKILSMRSAPNTQLPFGKFSDDITNLRTIYPSMTNPQLANHIASLAANKKVTDYTSLSHQDRPASPFLAPPLSTSPTKTRSRNSKRGISPPPPSLVSPKKSSIKTESSMEDGTVTIHSEGEDTVAPLPESIPKSRKNAPTKPVDKPLPEIQKEDYEWPEDVF